MNDGGMGTTKYTKKGRNSRGERVPKSKSTPAESSRCQTVASPPISWILSLLLNPLLLFAPDRS